MSIAGPLVTGKLAATTSTPEGARGFADLLANAEAAAGESAQAGLGSELAGLFGGAGGGDMAGMLDGVMGLMSASGGTGADMMSGILGQGVNAIGGTLSQSMGFDVKPLLSMAVPLVMGMVNKTAKEGNLDATGIANMLQTETKAFTADPANKEKMALINEAMEAGSKAEALRGKFNDADWMKIRMAPIAAAYLVAKASPSKGMGAVKELAAANDAVDEAVNRAAPTSLVGMAFGGGLSGKEWDVLEKDAPPDDRLLAGFSAAKAAVAAVSPNDAAAFSEMIIQVATKTAEAAKEGGFLGIGGQLVSDAEQAAVDAIKAALK